MAEQPERIRHTKKTSKGFLNYIHRVLNQVHPDIRITKVAIEQINLALSVIVTGLSSTAQKSTKRQNKKTVSSREVQYATRAILPGELAKHATGEGARAVTKYNSMFGDKIGEEKSNSTKGGPRREFRAGIIFSVSLCEKYLRSKKTSALRVGAGAPVYLAAVMEYLAAEIIELAGNASRDNKKATITTRFIFLAVANDSELSNLFEKFKIILSGGGVLPNIHPELLKKDKPRKKKAASSNEKGKKPHRFRPGTVALRQIRLYQKSVADLIQHLPFERLVRSFVKSETDVDNIRFSEGVILHLQRFVESALVTLYQAAQEFAIHGGREGVNDKDLGLALKYSSFPPAQKHQYEYITGPSLQRLARRGGIKRISGLFYDFSRDIIGGLVSAIIHHSILNIETLRTKTITSKVLVNSINDIGFNFIFA